VARPNADWARARRASDRVKKDFMITALSEIIWKRDLNASYQHQARLDKCPRSGSCWGLVGRRELCSVLMKEKKPGHERGDLI
jgi:hypothetical protein